VCLHLFRTVQTPGGVPAPHIRNHPLLSLSPSFYLFFFFFVLLYSVVERQSRKKLGAGDMAGIKQHHQSAAQLFFFLFSFR
jgi:hypothetical protein